MPQTSKRNSRAEKLAQARQYRRELYAKLKNDPEKYAAEKEKERLRYLKRKENKKLKTIEDLTPKERRIQRRKWRRNQKRYLKKKQTERSTNLNEGSQEQIPCFQQDNVETSSTNLDAVDPSRERLKLLDESSSEQIVLLEGRTRSQLETLEELYPLEGQKALVCNECNKKTREIKELKYMYKCEIAKLRNEIEKLKKNQQRLQKAVHSPEKRGDSSKAYRDYCTVL